MSWQKTDLASVLITIFLVLFAVIIIIPVWYTISVSLTSPFGYASTTFLLYPVDFTLKNYETLFQWSPMWTGLRNTLFITIVGTFYQVAVTTLAAYALLKPLPGRTFFWTLFIIIMFFGGGLIPFFLLVSNTLKLMNSLWSMILPAGLSIWHMILMQSYIRTLPKEYEESATIDGAGDVRVFFSIILPLCKPMLATITLFTIVGFWNQWFNGMLFMQHADGWPLQLVLRNMLSRASMVLQGMPSRVRQGVFPIGLQMAAVFFTMVPIMCVYPFLQKHFAKGITLGGLKG